ncbi:hypothetical protein ACFX10_020009 [Malus domestica]
MASSSLKIKSIRGMLTIRLNDTKNSKWALQSKAVHRGYKLFDQFDGTCVSPLKFVSNTETGVTKEISSAFQSSDSLKRDHRRTRTKLHTLGSTSAQLSNLGPDKEASSVGTIVTAPAESLVSGDKNGGGHGAENPMLSTGQVDDTVLISGNGVSIGDTVESLTAFEHEISDWLKIQHQLGAAASRGDGCCSAR